MALSLTQKPLFNTLPIGQQVLFTVSDPTTVALKFKVKYVAQIHVSNSSINLSNNNALIGTFKTTPNNAGVGIFDFRPVLETFVKPDNEASSTANSTYKGISSSITPFPIHLIDEYSLSDNSIKYFAVNFFIEYADSATDSVIDFNTLDATASDSYTMFNGVLQYDNVLTKSLVGNDYGYDLDEFYLDDINAKFLSNAPTTQYARLEDYGTLPFFNFHPTSTDKVTFMALKYYNSSDVQIGSDSILNQPSTGGVSAVGGADTRINYFGCFPANLRADGTTTFAALVTAGTIQGGYYTVRDGNGESLLYTIKILCPNLKGYEAIRLTWLNQWGTWDYYTFNMKSTRSVTTNRTSYTQLGGTWNESTFKIADYKGGKKNFRVNSTEKITLNTDFVTEAEGVWFEELINSNDVYIVNEYSTDVSNTITRKYVDPVVLTTSSYVKKTIANDRLMQYTFEIEKSRMKRTQAV
jgi:hypothetical protein